MVIDRAVIILQSAFLQFGLVPAQPVNKRFLDRAEIGASSPKFAGSLAVREMPGIIKSTDADFIQYGLPFKHQFLLRGLSWRNRNSLAAAHTLIGERDLGAVAANRYASLPCIHAYAAFVLMKIRPFGALSQ